ncbi:hypothetical protein MT080_004577 [Salmonella enterica]|nr:hypothetical protein [Salmonella enterica]
MATKAGDLVLDFHLGSGTTATVAHISIRRCVISITRSAILQKR